MIGPAYAQSDVLAWLFQKRHQWITAAGAFAATAAVLFAIFQLAFPDLIERTPLPVPALEVFCAVTAGTLVVLATVVAMKFLWMVERHRTERLRMAKFRFLIDPGIWCGERRWPRASAARGRGKDDPGDHVYLVPRVGRGVHPSGRAASAFDLSIAGGRAARPVDRLLPDQAAELPAGLLL